MSPRKYRIYIQVPRLHYQLHIIETKSNCIGSALTEVLQNYDFVMTMEDFVTSRITPSNSSWARFPKKKFFIFEKKMKCGRPS